MVISNQNISKDGYRPTLFYLAILLILLVMAYWPISFHVFSLKNDALNYFLPVRRLVSESYTNNFLPMWTPYLNMGYPLHGDMQSGVWNPIVQFFSLFGTYSLYTLMLETLLYIFLGGVGMFFLLKHFGVHPLANMLGATAYMLCGFNSDSCQFLNWIAGTSFLPFVFLFYYRCLKESSLVQGVYAGTALFFLFACAYPADFIITGYLLTAMLVVHIVRLWRKKEKIFSARFIWSHMGLLLTFLVLSAPAILSYMQSLPLQERGSGASFDDVMSNPLHPALLSSFTTPLGIWKMPGVAITDPLVRNSYMGLGGFILLLTALLSSSTHSLLRFSKWALLVFLLFSIGEFGGLRILSYYILPLMDTFRHPANARMFTIFFACILAAFCLDAVIKKEISVIKLRRAWWLTIGILLHILILSFFTPAGIFSKDSFDLISGPADGKTWGESLKSRLAAISYADIVLVNTIIQLAFLFLFYHYLVKKPNYRRFALIAILNSVLFAMLFQPFTVVKKARASEIQGLINEVAVEGYPLPALDISLSEMSRDNEKYMLEIGCLSMYNKKPGRSEYRITPSNLLRQNQFWFDTTFRQAILRYPLMYRADFIAGLEKKDQALRDTLGKWAVTGSATGITDQTGQRPYQIQMRSFKPNHFEGTIHSEEDGFFVLLQSYYPRWQLTVDGKDTPIEVVNTSFMGFRIPKGDHHFALHYQSGDLKVAFIISLLGLAGILILSVYRARRHRIKYILP